jgi:hypothetical protein
LEGPSTPLRTGEANPLDADRPDSLDQQSLEQRFKYAARFEKLLQRPQAEDVLDILRIYGETCLPLPRATERFYWSVSCLPSTSDKPLARVNASWMELFTLLPDEPSTASLPTPDPSLPGRGERGPSTPLRTGLRARIILHLSDFTTDGSPEPQHLDLALLEQCVVRPEACPEQSLSRACRGGRRDVGHFFWKADTLGIKVRGAASIRAFLAHPRALRAIRRFNLTHMNRGRNAYQASHCYSLADVMLGG